MVSMYSVYFIHLKVFVLLVFNFDIYTGISNFLLKIFKFILYITAVIGKGKHRYHDFILITSPYVIMLNTHVYAFVMHTYIISTSTTRACTRFTPFYFSEVSCKKINKFGIDFGFVHPGRKFIRVDI